ncbi:MAG: YceI family protein [Caldilineaceae bacterium]
MRIVSTSQRLISLLLAILLLGTLVACQAQPEQSNAESAPAAAAPVATTQAQPATAASAENAQPASGETAGVKRFQISQAGTEARFYIDEVLMGQDKTVVGVTSGVEGEITVDPANPTNAQISPITINARDFTTDSGNRNGAIRRFILQSNQDAYQFIHFEPTAIEGLPTAVTIGEPFAFTVTGNLTIRDITRPETFQMKVTANSADELTGVGSTTVLRDNYDLTIPRVPAVAGVADEVKLEIEFTAHAAP